MIRLTIPILIERITEGSERPFYSVRPVFFDSYARNAEREDVAVDRLTNAMRFTAIELAKNATHRLLARWSFYPSLVRHHVKLMLRLRKRTFEGKFFFVVFEEFGRKQVCCPKLPDICFELARGESLVTRAQEVLTEHYRKLEKEGACDPSEAATDGYVRIGEIGMEVKATQRLPDADFRPRFADIQSGERMDGAEEIERVGRCLDRLHPNRLERAILREKDVDKLVDLFSRDKEARRPVVIVGGSQVGKTAVVHEFVRRRIEGATKKKVAEDGRVWLLNPQRLISGMCYIGQWEERLLSIIREVRKRNHILYFDDLLGIFQAGKSRESELSIGHLLKAQLEEKPFEIVAEATPEAWRKLKELDRGFADLFQVVPMREPTDEETLRILIRVLQEIESERKCRFEPAVLPLVMELQRRFARTRAFPGKAAEQLHQVAASVPEKSTIYARYVRSHFQAKTGIAHLFLDRDSSLDRDSLRDYFDERIVGQEPAVKAMMDAITISKARLNDPGRPLSSMLFLGPTGVGKTECAKAMAEFVFGSAERMLRIDMNEYVGPDAVSRLIGDNSRPRGILTGALQRQPHTVLLLDEVEKAHPDVFNLLLQVLGDGRLTDAGGRTADFCNAVIILTSNLGARQSRMQMGFAPENRDESRVYVEAAEKFFRPEFFNRLDRVIPFHELTREHIEGMVERLAKKAFGRFGFRQRKMMLTVEPAVYDKIVDHGFDPEFGARALRRAIEEHLVQPLAGELARTKVGSLSTVRIVSGEDGNPELESTAFVEAARHPGCDFAPSFETGRAEAVLEAGHEFLERIGPALDDLDDEEADYAARAVYFDIRERLRGVRASCDRLKGFLGSRKQIGSGPAAPPSRFGERATRLHVPFESDRSILDELSTAADPGAYLNRLAEEAQIVDVQSFLCELLIQKAAFLNFVIEEKKGLADSANLHLTNVGKEGGGLMSWDVYQLVFPILKLIHAVPGGEARIVPLNSWDNLLAVEEKGKERKPSAGNPNREEFGSIEATGAAVKELLAFEYGTHLLYRESGEAVSTDMTESGELVTGDRTVVRAYHRGGYCHDFRTGIIAKGEFVSRWPFLSPLLPPPPEFVEFIGMD